MKACTLQNDTLDPVKELETRLSRQEETIAALRAREKRFTTVMDTIPHGIQENSVDGVITYSNRAHHRMLGYRDGELIGKSISSLLADQHEREYLDELLRELADTQATPEPYYAKNVTKDGRIIDVRVDWNYQRAADGKVVGFASVITDITDQLEGVQVQVESEQSYRAIFAKMERDLSEQVAFLQTLIDTLPHPIFYKDAQCRYLGCNKAFEHYIGLTRDELMGKTPHDIAPKELADIYLEADEDLLASPRHQIYEAQVRYADGSHRSVIFNKAVFYRKDGTQGGIVGAMVDITERKKAEEERELLAMAIKQAPEMIIITDLDGRIHYVNEAFERISGYSRQEAIGKTPGILKSGDHDAGHYQRMWALLKAGKPWSGRMTNRRKDGGLFEVEATIVPVQRHNGKVTDYLSVEKDISKELLREKQMQQAQKMEAIGTLAAGIAHDFNNILAAIVGYTDIALHETQADSPLRTYLHKVLKASDRAKSLVNQILAFSRSNDKEERPVVVQTIMKEALKLLKATLPSTIAIHASLNSKDAIVADPTQIHQVIMNLCTNAAHAMRDKCGKLIVILEAATLNEPVPSGSDNLDAGRYLRLVVKDTGEGIAEAAQERIFDPFYTTKKPGEGTGMGLSVVHGIVTECGGTIRVSSEVGVGSTFEILLPVIEEEPDIEQVEDRPLPLGNERILLIDDEPDIVEINTRMLEALGYRVTSATDSRKALSLFSQSPDAYDMVITDMTMPQMTGELLGSKILALRNDIPIIICTGYSERLTEENINAMGFAGIAYKPLIIKDLAELVRKTLDE